jgi:3-oxoacyl-[acyl-carrier-protein] synthase-3
MACVVQRDLGAVCPALDINGACAGFVYALDAADAYLKAGKAKRVLVVAAEAMSHIVDWTRREECVLFGDAAAAAWWTAARASWPCG